MDYTLPCSYNSENSLPETNPYTPHISFGSYMSMGVNYGMDLKF